MRSITKSRIKISYAAISVGALLCLLVLCFALIASDSFGWFSENKNVTANGMSVNTQAFSITVDYAEYDAATDTVGSFQPIGTDTALSIAGSIKAPGDIVYFKLRVTALEAAAISSVSFISPTQQEEKSSLLDANGNTAYLGTQIYAKAVLGDELPTFSDTDTPIFTVTDNTPQYSDTPLWSGSAPVDADESTADISQFVTFTVAVKFNNSNENQDIYKNFGQNEAEACARRISVIYTPNP